MLCRKWVTAIGQLAVQPHSNINKPTLVWIFPPWGVKESKRILRFIKGIILSHTKYMYTVNDLKIPSLHILLDSEDRIDLRRVIWSCSQDRVISYWKKYVSALKAIFYDIFLPMKYYLGVVGYMALCFLLNYLLKE